MGTSKNFSSPDTPPWKFALAVIGRLDVSPERQNREIWRSVEAERGSRATDELSQPSLAMACRLASGATNVPSTLRAYEEHLLRENKSGFALEVARRALARAVLSKQGSEGFARELFAEATSYYASRDLPSFVGSRGRVETTSAAVALKSTLKELTRQTVNTLGKPAQDPLGWSVYVEKVVRKLRGSR